MKLFISMNSDPDHLDSVLPQWDKRYESPLGAVVRMTVPSYVLAAVQKKYAPEQSYVSGINASVLAKNVCDATGLKSEKNSLGYLIQHEHNGLLIVPYDSRTSCVFWITL